MARTACNVQFLSLNTRGLRNKEKRYTVFRQVKNVADIVFLQELHCLEKDKNEWCNDWQGSMVLSCGTNNSCGVGILFKESLDHNIIDQIVDDKGRYIIMRCDIQDNSFILVNVYAPNREQDHNSFLKHLLNEMNTFIKDDDDFVILGGDWNFTPTIDIDRMGGNPKLWQYSLNTLENIQLQFDLLDIWRAKHPRTRRYTWRQPRPLIQSRIDYWLISDNLQPYVDKTDICPGTRTDHSAITLQIKTFEENPPGHSYWKFNNSLIKDLEYTNSVREHFQNWITEAEDIPYYRVQWDYLKYKIAQYSRTYTKEKARIKRAEVKELECRVKYLEGNLTDDLNISQYQEAKKDLDEHHNEITKGLVIRSRAQYYEEGEKSNRYFLNLIKRNRNKTCIRKLNIKNEMVTDTSQIMENIKQFYSKLYSKVDRPEPVQLEYNMFLNADLPRLSDAERLKLEADVTEEELFRTLQTFKTNKSPGNDGLSAEFFTFYWDDLKDLLMKAIKGVICRR
jgi:exonuclease III